MISDFAFIIVTSGVTEGTLKLNASRFVPKYANIAYVGKLSVGIAAVNMSIYLY